MNGSYKISMSTPIGPKNGTITFIDNNGSLSGYIRALGTENRFKDGKANGDSFEFSGTLKILFNRFEYTARGTVTGDTLKATANTKYGVMQINGTRI